MNNIFNDDYIGSKGIHNINDYIDYTSNILDNKINTTSNILINYTNTNISILDNKYNKLIKEIEEPITIPPIQTILKHTIICNSNLGGEIRFYINKPSSLLIPDNSIYINDAGYLMAYYKQITTINLLEQSGYKNILHEIISTKATVNLQGGFIATLQAETAGIITYLIKNRPQNEIGELLEAPAFDRTSTFSSITSALNIFGTRIQNLLFNNGYTLLLGSPIAVAVFAFAQYGADADATHTIATAIIDQYNSNTTMTQEEKNNLLIFGSNLYMNKYNSAINNFSNMCIYSGFINSNVVSQQYIPSLKIDTLSLNSGNITNVNNLNASTLTVTSIATTKLANVGPPSVGYFGGISDRVILYTAQNSSSYPYSIGINTNSLWNSIPSGSFDWYINGAINLSLYGGILNINGNFQENGNNLSSIYATNTNLNTTINNINNTLNLVYTAERQYPPKLYDSVINETSTVFNGINCYITSFTINSYINGYGIGNYIIYSSSAYTVQTGKNLLFNYNSAEVGAHFGNEYDANGLYIKSNYIKPDFLGDWIIIKLPNPIIMTKFRFYNRATLTRRSPGIWKLYGSNDGINFIEIVEGHNIVSRLIITDYTGLGLGYYEKVLASSFTSTFLYYGWTINKLVGSDNVLNFTELQIYGKELLNPIYNYISSNVLSNNLLNYLPLTGGTINGNLTATNFIQNGNFLDTIYTTNTNLNTIINSINNDITALYTIEKQYPPKTYDTTTTETATIYNGINCFTTSFNINTYINGYSIGEYITYASTSYSSTTGKNLLFNYNTADAEGAHWALNQYSSSGIYIGNNYIKNNYLGEWVIIKLPYKILLTRFRFYVRSPFTIRAPGEWRFYGSNDGITFTEITEASNLTRLTATSYSIGYYEQILANTFTTPYLYFAITVNKLVGNDTVLNFNEFQIFGKELLNPLINYTTSNVAQNIIIGNENIQKKYSFNFTCSTPITISSTTYYKYDIDLRNYTKTKPSANPLSPYRIFNIRIFLSSVYFEVMVNNTYNILNYEVYMSNEINAGSYGGQIGINIVANNIGGNTPPNPILTNILPSYFTLLRTADFNYLSVISTIQNINLNCIIQDILY